jgi:RNA polymerase sigma factor (sigma-70 family)
MRSISDFADGDLLAQFSRTRSEDAFGELVRRHIGLVHSVALRHTDNLRQAEEITQAVFILLAHKADSIGSKTLLSGWLYHAARLTASNVRRSEFRRIRREQEAFMQSTPEETQSDSAWCELAPLLDQAMARLGATDRNAVVLRYFENRTLLEVGAALGVEERAAQKRVQRAVEKLRDFFTKRGVVVPLAIMTSAISAHSVQAAPVALAKSVSAVAIGKGVAASASALTLTKGALKIMAWTKAKMAIGVGVGLLAVMGTTTVAVYQISAPKYNSKDFWATVYPTGPADMMKYMTNSYGHPLNYSFPITPVQRCSVSGLLNQCMEVSGWRYLIDNGVSAGSVEFGCPRAYNGQEWVAAFENALQTNRPEWWAANKKGFRKENLVLIRFPKEKVVLVLPADKAAKYQ